MTLCSCGRLVASAASAACCLDRQVHDWFFDILCCALDPLRAAAALCRFVASLRDSPRSPTPRVSHPRCAPAPFIARGPSVSARALLAGRHKRLSNAHARHTNLK
eukprot:613545-Pleurochrysis_carterae.AAC.1